MAGYLVVLREMAETEWAGWLSQATSRLPPGVSHPVAWVASPGHELLWAFSFWRQLLEGGLGEELLDGFLLVKLAFVFAQDNSLKKDTNISQNIFFFHILRFQQG